MARLGHQQSSLLWRFDLVRVERKLQELALHTCEAMPSLRFDPGSDSTVT